MNSEDIYRTLASPADECLFKEKNSKFYGYAFPITTEEETKPLIDSLRKKHPTAGHFCYAYRLGTSKVKYRTNDDGEPSNSAGLPIYGQIQSCKLTNVLIVVVRYFGGTKLGVGGLISAYKTTAQLTLEQTEIIEKTITTHFLLSFDYKNLNKVMRVIKEKNLEIITQKMERDCKIEIATRKSNTNEIDSIFKNIFEVRVEIKE